MPHSPTEDTRPTLAYLMTDVVGSTPLWEAEIADMRQAVLRLDEVCAREIEQARGILLKERGEGDSHFSVFNSAEDAVAGAANLFLAIKADPSLSKIVLRAAIHLGTAESWGGDHYGPTINRCARIRQATRPGQILVSEAVQVTARGKGFAFKDLGVHRLRDLMHPERLFQLVYPGLESEFSPPDTLSELSHNLPSYLSSFVGRKQDIEDLTQLIHSSRLVTVTGAGGVGKTRLTQQVAAECVERFRDGAWFVNLAQTDRAESVLPILCMEFDGGLEASEAKLLESLQHRQMLVILDNCEHLFEECRRVAAAILAHCPGIRIIATSRRILDVRGEHVYKLGGLRLPTSDQLHDAPQFDGFQLFVERAKQRGNAQTVDDTSIPGIVELCAKLDGLPLGIEIVASLTDVLSVKEISRSIAECLDIPTGLAADDVRQHTISATIDWSRRLLSEEASLLLDRVAFFPNTWNMDGARAVCFPEKSVAQVRALVRELVNHSLAFVSRAARDDTRFGLLQTTREVVASRMGAQNGLAPTYMAYCRTLIDGARALSDSGDEAQAHELVDQDYETLVKALDISFVRGPDICAEMALELRSYWMSGSRLREGRAWYERLAASGEIDRSKLVAVQIALSSLYILLGDNDGAQRVLLAAEEMVRPIGGFELALVVGNLAVHQDRMGRYEDAKKGFEQSVEMFRECGAKREESLSLLNLGVAKLRLGDPLAECADLYLQALAYARDLGLTSRQAKAHSCLAHVDLKEGRLARAMDHNRQALQLWLSDPIIPDSNLAMLDLAEIFIRRDRFDAAAQALHLAERLEEMSGSPLPSLHRVRFESLREIVRPQILPSEWRSGQRLTRSKSAQELVTMAIQLIEAEDQALHQSEKNSLT